jgi:hypothetical protein
MAAIFDAFWRALFDCLHWRVLAWAMLPLLLLASGVALLGWMYWEPLIDGVRATLERLELLKMLLDWLATQGAGHLRSVLAPLIVVAVAVPLVVMLTLVFVGLVVAPVAARRVAARRFVGLERRQGASLVQSAGWSFACSLGALAALVCSVPLWFVPPLALILPPLIWGWLSYRVLAFDALAEHADAAERRIVMRTRRWPLLLMGLVVGAGGALPSALWAFGAATLIFAPLLLVVSVWMYTSLFVFAACWFAHYTLAELQALRAAAAVPTPQPTPLLEPTP